MQYIRDKRLNAATDEVTTRIFFWSEWVYSSQRVVARTLWMSFFFGFRSPYFVRICSSCCRMISAGEGWAQDRRGGRVSEGSTGCLTAPLGVERKMRNRSVFERTSGSMVRIAWFARSTEVVTV